ncbi:MAG: class I SAM-dependent methyltransferase [Bacteroidales bacterium]|nr:class I SAM-dependent methyltransferase [Bacteroidales bacterium]
MSTPNKEQQQMVSDIRQIDIAGLQLSDYSRMALLRITDALEFYLEIYRYAIEKVLEMAHIFPEHAVVVDYGGGHGLLSIFAKRLHFKRVIYVDNNTDAIQTVKILSEKLGDGPDDILSGDAKVLKEWCLNNDVCPDALLSVDVIEHIYVLDDFFSMMHDINPFMSMVFTTASTPYNKRVIRRLHRAMVCDEQGHNGEKGFLTLRREYIAGKYTDMPDRQLDYWAENTRGLTYEDIDRAIDSQSPNLLLDSYNTCDPATGNWTERILPIDDYRHILAPYGYSLTVLPGRYNEHRSGPKEWASLHYNKIIDKSPSGEPTTRRESRRYKKALKVAPFIYLIVKR